MVLIDDLRDLDYSLDEVLRKHKLNLKTAFDVSPMPSTPREYGHNIYYNNGKYVVKKMIFGKYKYFGAYDSFDDALRVRNLLGEHRWNINLDCEILGNTKG